jgi:hypothetical protein
MYITGHGHSQIISPLLDHQTVDAAIALNMYIIFTLLINKAMLWTWGLITSVVNIISCIHTQHGEFSPSSVPSPIPLLPHLFQDS